MIASLINGSPNVRSSLFALLVVLTSTHVFAQAPPPAPLIYDLTATAPQQFDPVVEVYECFLAINGQTNATLVPPAGPPVTLTPTFTTMTPPPPMPATQTYSKHVGAVQINNPAPAPSRYYWVKAYYYDNTGNGVKNYVLVTQTKRP